MFKNLKKQYHLSIVILPLSLGVLLPLSNTLLEKEKCLNHLSFLLNGK